MEIRNVRHKGLRAFVEYGQTKGSPAAHVAKIRDIVGFLADMDAIEEVFTLPKYKPHTLTGDRAGTISLSVTPNWRVTFRHDAETNEIVDLDYEDYH